MFDGKPSFLLTDLYELTMSAAFLENDFNPIASFELFVRRLPMGRGYLVSAGLEQALQWLEQARFDDQDIDFLRSHPAFAHVGDAFFETLRQLRFTGDMWAMPEGTLAFAEEPILRVTAPLIQAQIVETYLLSVITFETMIATKASRIAAASQGCDVIEFGARRAHGPGASLLAARAAFIGGCVGTSNVQAGREFGIPTFGTMAHSFVMAIKDETVAFKQYTNLFPETSVLLVDTYDTVGAIGKIVEARLRPTAVRLDSGDLAELSRQVRQKLDAAGLKTTKILLSGDLDEFKIADLLASGTPADAFGVGTSLVVSSDAPSLGGVYKLVEIQKGEAKSYHAKFSHDKATYPGTKQVYRFRDSHGLFARDLIACSGERVQGGEALLQPVLRQGKRVLEPAESLQNIRERARNQMAFLPARVRKLTDPEPYEVNFSSELDRLQQAVRRERVP